MFKGCFPNETLEVTRFDNYHQIDEKIGDRLPHADGVFLKKIVDETVRLTALRAGEMAFIETPPRNVIGNELKNPTPGITISVSMKLDWDDAYYLYFHSSEIGKNNCARYAYKELDKLLEQGRSTRKVVDRKPIYEKRSRF